jgi:gamma-glutamylcyclotransferase (GGCT)/AIG2-like uncharacterized protein YtfP
VAAESSDTTFNLFTYGTLRSGGPAADMLAGCELLGAATVNGILYDIEGRYPAMVMYGEVPVTGEVWRCPPAKLLELDRYEGVAERLFRRVATEAEMPGGPVACWLYTAGPAISRKLRPEARLAGSWR